MEFQISSTGTAFLLTCLRLFGHIFPVMLAPLVQSENGDLFVYFIVHAQLYVVLWVL